MVINCSNVKTKNVVPLIILNSGNKMPMIGLGTSKCSNGAIKQAVKHAIKCGYRHFDTAFHYDSQRGVAEGIAESISEGLVKRQNLFITHKNWMTHQNLEDVRSGILKSLALFEMDYFDLYLIHFPVGLRKQVDMDSNWPFTDIDYVETWKAFIELKKDGLVRDIGVSNFNEYQLNRLLNDTSVVPAVNQIENHPYLIQEDLVTFCQQNNIAIVAHTPLGSFGGYLFKELDHEVLSNPKIKEIATRLSKSPAQIALRFQIQRNIVVIPKSVTPSRIKENIRVFDFELSEDDMSSISSLNKNYRVSDWNMKEFFNHHDITKHKHYPFRSDYAE